MLQIQGTAQHYAWGTTDAIPQLLGRPSDGTPFAEYWLGAHPSAPATVNGESLNHLLSAQPELLGQASRQSFGDQLPYLVKVLSARHALSLQAHPSREQAEDGFAREEAAGVPLDSAERTYPDDWPKPEILVALNEFHSLCGFRDPRRTHALFSGLGVAEDLASVIGPLTERRGAAALEEVFLDVLSLCGDRARLSELVCAAAMQHRNDPGELGSFARTVIELDDVFPADPGILAALLMNRITLKPGQAMYVPAGQMHAHLRGTGVEIMANSNNVIRGGLTPKHVDVGELIKVVDFEPINPRITKPVKESPGIEHFPTDCPEFDVWRISPAPELSWLPVPGEGSARIALVTAGSIQARSHDSTVSLRQGQAVFVGANETAHLSGHGDVFVAAAGQR